MIEENLYNDLLKKMKIIINKSLRLELDDNTVAKTNLIAQYDITSVTMMEILVNIEVEFSIELDLSEITLSTLDSLDNLINIVYSKLVVKETI